MKERSGKVQGRVREGSGKIWESRNLEENEVPSYEIPRKSYEIEAPEEVYALRLIKCPKILNILEKH